MVNKEAILGCYVAADGSDLHFRHWPGKCIDEQAPILFLHSLFFDGSMFDVVAHHIGSQYDCYAPDLRGQGGSPSYGLAPTMSQLAQDTIEFIEGLIGRPVHLVGSSMGGYVALAIAERRPDLIWSLTLSCCTAEAERDPARFRALEDKLRTMDKAERVDALIRLMFGGRFIERGDTVALERWCNHFSALKPSIADAVHCVFTRMGSESVLNELHLPVLLISGALDRAKKPDDMQRIADRIQGSRHITFPDAGHTPAVESPEAYARELLDFLDGVKLKRNAKLDLNNP